MTELTARNAGLFHSIAEAFGRFRRRQVRMSELEALGSAESARVATDVGLSRSELMGLSVLDEDSADLMERRLADNGIDVKSLDPTLVRDMQRCCSHCESKEQCQYELEDKPRAAAWPRYCPNEQTMAALIATKCNCH